MSAALWVLVVLPAAAGLALSVSGRRGDRFAVPASITASSVSVVLAGAVAITRPQIEVPFMTGLPFGLAVDGLSALMIVMAAVVTVLVLIFAAAEGIERPARFHGLMLLFASAVTVTATATTLPTLLFAWELMGALSYALIGFQWREERRVSAGLTAFTVTRTGDLGLYLAAGAALIGGAGMRLDDLPSAESPARDLIAGGILLAALGKAAQLPFSFWLSRAMEGPSTVSALLHSAAMVAMGGYLLLRVVPLLEVTGWAATTAAWFGALTALLLGAVAIAQRDLKQLLAASTSAQLGLVVLAAGVGAVAGGTTQLVAHASTKALLFLVAGAWLSALGTKQLSALRGVARRWPLVGVTFAIGALSLAGVAPLSLWATKDELLAAVLAANPVLYVIGLAASVLSAVYAGKALFIVWRRPDARTDGYDSEQAGTRHIGGWERMPLLVLAAGAATLGVLALPPVSELISGMLGAESDPKPGALELVGSALLAAAVLAVVFWKGAPRLAWAADWLGLERMAELLVVRLVLALSESLARFDDRILDRGLIRTARAGRRGASRFASFDDRRLDGAVTATSDGTVAAAFGSARFDNGSVDRAVEGIAATGGRLGRLARRPQSGQLHQYYAQIAVVLGVALVLLVVVR